ncbi:MAG: site-specific integrase [Deltaproteobacteria bacterium]|nr:site-specific integrase [Deltaproteobacteria bacterium]
MSRCNDSVESLHGSDAAGRRKETEVAKPTKHRDKWRIRWWDERGERQSEVFDTYRDATAELARRQAEVEEIRLGLRASVPKDKTFADAAAHWTKHKVPQKRSGRDDMSILKRHLSPFFADMLLRNITAEHFDAFSSGWKLDRKTLHNVQTLLVAILRMACFELRWVALLPKFRKVKIPKTSAYRWLKTNDEIRRFLAAASEEGRLVFVLYAMALYTGMREGELVRLRWSNVDLDRRLILVSESFNGPTKSGELRHVPILDPLLPILRQWSKEHPGTLLFTNRDGNPIQESARIFQEVLVRVLDAAGFERPVVDENAPVRRRRQHAICFHDLRHTFASHWVLSGGDIYRLQRILGHANVQMTMRYAHLAPDAFVADHARLPDLTGLRAAQAAE